MCLLGEAAQTTDRVLVFLIEVMVSSISHAGRSRRHCYASLFQEQAAILPVVVYIFYLFSIVITTVAEHLCEG